MQNLHHSLITLSVNLKCGKIQPQKLIVNVQLPKNIWGLFTPMYYSAAGEELTSFSHPLKAEKFMSPFFLIMRVNIHLSFVRVSIHSPSSKHLQERLPKNCSVGQPGLEESNFPSDNVPLLPVPSPKGFCQKQQQEPMKPFLQWRSVGAKTLRSLL